MENREQSGKVKKKWLWQSQKKPIEKKPRERFFTLRLTKNPNFVIRAKFEKASFDPKVESSGLVDVGEILEIFQLLDTSTMSWDSSNLVTKVGRLEWSDVSCGRQLVNKLNSTLENDLVLKVKSVKSIETGVEFEITSSRRGHLPPREISGL